MSWSASTEWEQWDPDLPIVCPFNPAHVVSAKRYQRHVVKCRQNHPDKDFVECPFNARHLMLRSELRHHIAHCKFRKTVDRDVALDNEKDGDLYFKGNTRVPSYRNNLPEPDEDWDQELDNQDAAEEDTYGYNAPYQQGPIMTDSLSSDERSNFKLLMKRKALANQSTHVELSGDGMGHGGHQSGDWDTPYNAGQLGNYGPGDTHYDERPFPSPSNHQSDASATSYRQYDVPGQESGTWGNTRVGSGGAFSPQDAIRQRDRFTSRRDWDGETRMDRNMNEDRGGVGHSGENNEQIYNQESHSARTTKRSPQNPSALPSDSWRGRGRADHSGIHPNDNHRAIGRGIGLLTQAPSKRRPGMSSQHQGSWS